MIPLLTYSLLGLYILGLVYISIFCSMQIWLMVKLWIHGTATTIPEKLTSTPFVSIQIPIYNEKFVVERIIRALTNLDYPKALYEIRILDDSTDETSNIVHNFIQPYIENGFQIKHVQRPNRQGFKAGALQDDLPNTQGAFIAIFDADFIPKPDFLRKTLPYFQHAHIGVVQTRWGHVNENFSLLTRIQAFLLNVHFTIEQKGRQQSNYLLQFNGTGGIWRKQAIIDAGGWSADTITEDLDLSIRAQLSGYKIEYLLEVESPGELPIEMNGYKSQQFRWMQGGIETAKKLIPTIWKSTLTWNQKIHAMLHVCGASIFMAIFMVGMVTVPLVYLLPQIDINLAILNVFKFITVGIIVIYFFANIVVVWKGASFLKNFMRYLALLPTSLAFSAGLSFHNSMAVIKGLKGAKSSFVRTPKYNVKTNKKIATNTYKQKNLPPYTFVEGTCMFIYLCAIALGLYLDNWSFIYFHILLAFGFALTFGMSLYHGKNFNLD